MPKGDGLYSEGDRIGERFLVLEKIGSGGIGEVFKVQDADESILACKVFYPKVVPAYIKLDKISKTLIEQVPDVPGLVRPKEILEVDGNRVAVSNFIPGMNLREFFKSEADAKRMTSVFTMGGIVNKVLTVLMTFPTLSIHGLIKPTNVILQGISQDGEVSDNAVAFLTDFGACRLLSFSKFASIQLGRSNDYYYLAPEYISQGGRVARTADIYAIGVMLYEGLTGQVPKKDFPRLKKAAKNIDPAIDEMVHKALSKQPAKRFQEFGVMRDALREAIPDLPEIAVAAAAFEEKPERIETEDIFLIDKKDERLTEDIEEIDVFGDMDEQGALDEEQIGEPEDVVVAEPVDERGQDEGVEPEEEPEEAADVFSIDEELVQATTIVEDEVVPEAELIDTKVDEAEPVDDFKEAEPLEEEMEGVEEEPEAEEKPAEELIVEEAQEVQEEPEEDIEHEQETPEEPRDEEKPKPPKAKDAKGFSLGTIIVFGLFILMAGLVIWKFITSQPEPAPSAPTPKMITPAPVPTPAPPPKTDKEKTPEETVSPTPEPTPETVAAKISALITLGKEQRLKKQYLEPSDKNLFITVQELEKLDPKNAFIKQARKRMLYEFIARTKKEMGKKNWDKAESAAKDGLKIRTDDLELTNLLSKIAEERKVQEEKKPEAPTTCREAMIMVAGGTLRMGSSPDDPMRQPAERTLDPVYVPGFCIDRYEYPNNPGASPKIKVSWYEAKAACESQGKRLCKEREWERACKGPKNHRYPYGDDFSSTICNTAKDDGSKGTLSSIGSFKDCKSPFGIYDLSGNVREWTASRIAPGNPAYVVKGGSAYKSEKSTRCAVREFAMPGETSSLIGFRCCADIKAK